MTGLAHVPLYLAVFAITLLNSTANITMTGVKCIALKPKKRLDRK
jgi:hypothetical protein